MSRVRPFLPALVLLATVFAVYGASLGFDFVWDDGPLIVDNHRIKDPELIATLVTSSFWETGDYYDRFRAFFRPVVSLTYVVDYTLWQLRPVGYHLSNVLMHWGVVLLVMTIARQEGLSRLASIAGALLFAVHPVHVENVAWISGRTDLMCVLLALGAFALHRRGRLSGKSGAGPLALALFLAALLAKEMAATLPVLVLLSVYLGSDEAGRGWRRWRAAGWAAAPFFAVLALYLAIRVAVLGPAGSELLRLPLDEYLATAIFVVSRYLQLSILPVGLDPHHAYSPLEGLFAPEALVGAAMLAVVALFGAILLRRSRRMGFWLLWFFVTLTPVLDFGSFGDVIMADRFLYLPTVAVALLVAHTWHAVASSKPSATGARLAIAGYAVSLVALGLTAWSESRIWSDNTTLFTRMVVTSPDSAMVRSNLGYSLYVDGDYLAAKSQLRRAIAIAPGYALAHNKLGAALEREGRLAEAYRHYQTAHDLAPDLLEASVNTARVLTIFGRTEDALESLEKVVRDSPRYVPGLYSYADALQRTGETDAAMALAERVLDIDPHFASAYYLIGKIRFEAGERDLAADSMRRFLELWEEEGLYRDAAMRVIAGSEAESEVPL